MFGCQVTRQPDEIVEADDRLVPAAIDPEFSDMPSTQPVVELLPVASPQLRPLARLGEPSRPAVDEANAAPSAAAAVKALLQAKQGNTELPKPGDFLNANQVYDYVAGVVFTAVCSPGFVTTIMLEPGEAISAITAGDTTRWQLETVEGGGGAAGESRTFILLKPAKPECETNLVIITDRRVYQLDLKSVGQAVYHTQINWHYPGLRVGGARAGSGVRDKDQPLGRFVIDKLNFNYLIKKQKGEAPAWCPLRAFDDGSKSYIQICARAADQRSAAPVRACRQRRGAGGELPCEGRLLHHRSTVRPRRAATRRASAAAGADRAGRSETLAIRNGVTMPSAELETPEADAAMNPRLAIEPRARPGRGTGLKKEMVYLAALVGAAVILGGLSVASQRQRNAPQAFADTPMVFGKPDMAQTTPMARLPGNYAGFDFAWPVAVESRAPRFGESAGHATQSADTGDLDRLRLALAQSEMDRQNQQHDRAMAEYEAAMNSPLLFKRAPIVRPGQAGLAPSFQGIDVPAHGAMSPSPGSAGGVTQDAKSRFLTDVSTVEPYLRKPLIGVQSDFELKAGGFIPVALLTAINSDLPGEVIAQVSQNVYDTVTGDHLLIPQGSRVLGTYHSLVSNGQNRALIVWTRLVMPNGDSVVLEGMPGTDQSGAAGTQDEVDYHLDKLAAAATLSTAIAYGGNLAREGGRDRDDLDVVGETIAQESSKIGGRIIDRQLDVQPTIKIRQGYPLNVLVNKDMILRPYQEK